MNNNESRPYIRNRQTIRKMESWSYYLPFKPRFLLTVTALILCLVVTILFNNVNYHLGLLVERDPASALSPVQAFLVNLQLTIPNIRSFLSIPLLLLVNPEFRELEPISMTVCIVIALFVEYLLSGLLQFSDTANGLFPVALLTLLSLILGIICWDYLEQYWKELKLLEDLEFEQMDKEHKDLQKEQKKIIDRLRSYNHTFNKLFIESQKLSLLSSSFQTLSEESEKQFKISEEIEKIPPTEVENLVASYGELGLSSIVLEFSQLNRVKQLESKKLSELYNEYNQRDEYNRYKNEYDQYKLKSEIILNAKLNYCWEINRFMNSFVKLLMADIISIVLFSLTVEEENNRIEGIIIEKINQLPSPKVKKLLLTRYKYQDLNFSDVLEFLDLKTLIFGILRLEELDVNKFRDFLRDEFGYNPIEPQEYEKFQLTLENKEFSNRYYLGRNSYKYDSHKIQAFQNKLEEKLNAKLIFYPDIYPIDDSFVKLLIQNVINQKEISLYNEFLSSFIFRTPNKIRKITSQGSLFTFVLLSLNQLIFLIFYIGGFWVDIRIINNYIYVFLGFLAVYICGMVYLLIRRCLCETPVRYVIERLIDIAFNGIEWLDFPFVFLKDCADSIPEDFLPFTDPLDTSGLLNPLLIIAIEFFNISVKTISLTTLITVKIIKTSAFCLLFLFSLTRIILTAITIVVPISLVIIIFFSIMPLVRLFWV